MVSAVSGGALFCFGDKTSKTVNKTSLTPFELHKY